MDDTLMMKAGSPDCVMSPFNGDGMVRVWLEYGDKIASEK
jgi:hypothetical protein